MAKNRTNLGYLSYDDMLKKISEGIINQYDVVFTNDTFETFIVSEELEPKPLKSRVYVFTSVTEAIQKLNKNTDTYVGQLVSILNGDSYRGYIVNLKNGAYTVNALNELSFIDYDTLGNKPIINLIGESDNPLIISDLENGTYSVSGHFKIATNDITTHLNPNTTIFIVEHDNDIVNIKKIATKEIIDYVVENDSNIIANQYITKNFLEKNGYATTTYVDEKILALDFIRREDMVTYVEELFTSFVDEKFIPLVDERIDKKIVGASEEEIYSLFKN